MKANCIGAVQKALGRDATKSELDEIESRLVNQMKLMARNDRASILAMSPAERMTIAADRAAKELMYEKERIVLNKAANISAKAKLREIIDSNPGRAVDKLIDVIAHDSGGTGILSLETRARTIYEQSIGEMLDSIIAAQPKFLGLFEDTKGVDDLFKELHGEDSGNPIASAGAKQFKEVSEKLRQRMNRSGGNIGKLEDWSLPSHHSHARITAAGRDAWVKDMTKMVNPDKYVNPDGSLYSPQQLKEFLEYSYSSISTGGANKVLEAAAKGESISVGVGSAANRGSAHRQLHFKDAASQKSYWDKYGESGLLDIMIGHISGISRDIALVETLGPNAMANFKAELDYAVAKDSVMNPNDLQKIEGKAQRAKVLLDEVSGNVAGPANAAFANIARGVRSINTMVLGSAFITSLSDYGFSWLTSGHNKLKFTQVLQTELNLLKSPEMRDFARRRGLGVDSMVSGLSRMASDGFESYSGKAEVFAKYSQKMASAVMKASFLSQATDLRRQSFAITFQDVLGKLTRRDFNSYAPDDIAHLTKLGVNADDWAIWQLAKTEDPRGAGDTILTSRAVSSITPAELIAAMPDRFADFSNPEAYAERIIDNATTKLLGITQDEARMAIIEPGLKTKASMRLGQQAGTVQGELLNSFWQFKSFGVAAIYSHLNRAMSLPNGVGKAAYVAKLVGATTLGGAVSYQLSQLLTGKDPQDMNPATKDGQKFWMASFLKGGSFGIYGDFLFSQTSKMGQSLASIVLGPTGSKIIDPLAIAGAELQYQKDKAAGLPTKEPDTAAAALRYVKPLIPGTTLWYAKGAFDHIIWHDLQEMANPGYLNRMEKRAKSETGQKFWWEPGEALPSRTPDYGSDGQ